MSRHSKNNTAGMIFTYHERQLLKYGTISERIGQDSIKDYDSCSICLHSVEDPMICKKGHLFCKECIYTYLLSQKKEIERHMVKWGEQEYRKKEEESQK